MKQTSGILAAAILMGMTQSAWALDFKPIVGYEWSKISGSVQDGIDELSLKNDLGVEKSNQTLAGFQIGALGQHLRFRYVPYSFSGNSTPDGSINFGGEDLSGNIDSSIKLTEYALDYRFIPINTPLGYLGLGAGVNVFDGDISLKTDTDEARSSASLPIPTLGVAAGVHLPFTGLTLNGDLSGLGYDGNHYRNLELNLDYQPFALMGLRVGYRDRQVKLESGDLKVDFKLSGPFAALWVGF
jgi:outer membrane protein